MGILIYRNSLTEELKPQQFTFTDTELLNLFVEFPFVRTHRLSEVPNTWVLWGEHDKLEKEDDEYNEIGSALVQEIVFSPIFFIHDTEINPEWNLTDDIIQTNYDNFKRELFKFIDETAYLIMLEKEEIQKQSGQENNNIIVLEQTEVTDQKQIVYKLDLNKQPSEFFKREIFLEFSMKAHDFLTKYYANGHTFLIFADKNILIKIDDNQVKPLIDKIIKTFQDEEQYELCLDIKTIYDKWSKFKSKKRRSPKKINNPENKHN